MRNGILPDSEIRRLCTKDNPVPLISPFAERTERNESGSRIPSYGLGPTGYDIRQGADLLVYKSFLISHNGGFATPEESTVDVRDFNEDILEPLELFNSHGLRWFVLPPRSFALGVALERINLPPDISATVWPKSTWARAGLAVINTVIEPGWGEELVLEYSNLHDLPIKLYIDVGIAQLRFTRSDPAPERSYADLNGRYQKQRGITPPR